MSQPSRAVLIGFVAVTWASGGCEKPATKANAPVGATHDGPVATTSDAAPAVTSDAAPAAGTAAKPPRAQDVVVDGIRLGDRYGSTVMARDPYREPCDDDGVDEPRVRAMVYGGRPCRDHAFPDETSVIFLIDWAERDDFDQPIRTIAWLGGHHFDTRVALPVKIGDPAELVAASWGAPTDRLALGALSIARYGDDFYVATERDVVVGFILGAMPASVGQDGVGERWEIVEQMYRRYSPRPAAPGVTKADCEAILRKAWTLQGGGDAARFEAKLPREVDQCAAEAPAEAVQCALAATTLDELQRCK